MNEAFASIAAIQEDLKAMRGDLRGLTVRVMQLQGEVLHHSDRLDSLPAVKFQLEEMTSWMKAVKSDMKGEDMNPDRAQIAALSALRPSTELIALPTDKAARVALLLRLLRETMPEPAPTAGTGDVWAELLAQPWFPAHLRAHAEARRLFGLAKYGTPLQRDNGRGIGDLTDELADAAVYAWLYLGDHVITRDALRLWGDAVEVAK